MVNAEKHKAESNAAADGVKPIKSTIAVDEFKDENGIDYFALSGLYGHEIKQYVADNFKKEITDLDILNLSLHFCNAIITTDDADEKAELLKDISDILNDEYKKNEYIFTRLATIKSWNETTAALFGKKDVSEKQFNDLMKKNNEKNQYKAWNDERQILDMYSSKSATGGVSNG